MNRGMEGWRYLGALRVSTESSGFLSTTRFVRKGGLGRYFPRTENLPLCARKRDIYHKALQRIRYHTYIGAQYSYQEKAFSYDIRGH